jgi:hypothetical protein
MHVTTPHLLLTFKKFCQPSCGISTFHLHICCLKQEKCQGAFEAHQAWVLPASVGQASWPRSGCAEAYRVCIRLPLTIGQSAQGGGFTRRPWQHPNTGRQCQRRTSAAMPWRIRQGNAADILPANT